MVYLHFHLAALFFFFPESEVPHLEGFFSAKAIRRHGVRSEESSSASSSAHCSPDVQSELHRVLSCLAPAESSSRGAEPGPPASATPTASLRQEVSDSFMLPNLGTPNMGHITWGVGEKWRSLSSDSSSSASTFSRHDLWGGLPPSPSPPVLVCADCRKDASKVISLSQVGEATGVGGFRLGVHGAMPISETSTYFGGVARQYVLTAYATQVIEQAFGDPAALEAAITERKREKEKREAAAKLAREAAEKEQEECVANERFHCRFRSVFGGGIPLTGRQAHLLLNPDTTLWQATKEDDRPRPEQKGFLKNNGFVSSERPRLPVGPRVPEHLSTWLQNYRLPYGVTLHGFVRGQGLINPPRNRSGDGTLISYSFYDDVADIKGPCTCGCCASS